MNSSSTKAAMTTNEKRGNSAGIAIVAKMFGDAGGSLMKIATGAANSGWCALIVQ